MFRQNYLYDVLAMRMGALNDGTLVFLQGSERCTGGYRNGLQLALDQATVLLPRANTVAELFVGGVRRQPHGVSRAPAVVLPFSTATLLLQLA